MSFLTVEQCKQGENFLKQRLRVKETQQFCCLHFDPLRYVDSISDTI